MKEDQRDSVRGASVEVLERPPIREGQRRQHARRLRPMFTSEQRSVVPRSCSQHGTASYAACSASPRWVFPPHQDANYHAATRAPRP